MNVSTPLASPTLTPDVARIVAGFHGHGSWRPSSGERLLCEAAHGLDIDTASACLPAGLVSAVELYRASGVSALTAVYEVAS